MTTEVDDDFGCLNDLERLNERFYELYGRLYENTELLTEKQYNFMAERLFEQYRAEYALRSEIMKIERAKQEYSVQIQQEEYMPKRPWWKLFKPNRAARLIEEEICAEADAYFGERYAELEGESDYEYSTEEPAEPVQSEPQAEQEKPAEPVQSEPQAEQEKPAEPVQSEPQAEQEKPAELVQSEPQEKTKGKRKCA